jgi:hypothetical protein
MTTNFNCITNDTVRHYLSKGIKVAKKIHHNKMILNSKNKMESMWKIIKTETDKTNQEMRVQSLKINNTITDNHTMTTNTFNKNFISVADSINNKQQC